MYDHNENIYISCLMHLLLSPLSNTFRRIKFPVSQMIFGSERICYFTNKSVQFQE